MGQTGFCESLRFRDAQIPRKKKSAKTSEKQRKTATLALSLLVCPF